MALTQQLTATPKNSLGNPLTGRTIAWASLNPAVATVSNTGLVTSVAPGTAVITATTGSVTSNATCTVAAAPVQLFYFAQPSTNPSIARSGSTIIPLSIIRGNGYAGDIVLSASPSTASGLSYEFSLSPSSGFGSSLTLTSATSDTFYVKISATSVASLGTFALGVEGNGTGSKFANVVLSATVTGTATPSISISTTLAPYTIVNVARNAAVNFTVNLIRNGGYTSDVTPVIAATAMVTPAFAGGPIPIAKFPVVTVSDSTLSGAEASVVYTMQFPAEFAGQSRAVYFSMSGVGIESAFCGPIVVNIT